MKTLQFSKSLRRLVLCTLALSVLSLSGCNQSEQNSQLDTMVKRGKLRVGTVFGASSYYIDRDGSTGFEYELTQAFADYLGLELEVVPNYHVSQLFPMLESDQVDLLAGGLTVTDERRKKYRYSPSYYKVSQKLVFKQGNKRPKKFEQLNGSLVVTTQSSHAENLASLKNQYPDLTWIETADADPDELLEQVINGTIDYTIADSNNLAINRRHYPNLSIGFTVHKEQDVGWIITKQNDDSLLSLLIEFFGHIRQNGELTELRDKYFGHVKKFNYSDTKMFIKATQTKLPNLCV
ncbi:MAG: transporter substrate-binding domain-containing protein [Psychrosphaera sp.]|nr:transporter substrate-binding domain-containing protein [Psychrosphaera sp.]